MQSGHETQLAHHIARAADLLRASRIVEAEAELQRARGIDADDVRVRNLGCLFDFRAGRYHIAEVGYESLQRDYPDDTALRLNLGLVKLRLGKYPEAEDHLRQVTISEPDNARAFGYLGLALMRQNRPEDARAALEKGASWPLAKQLEETMTSDTSSESLAEPEPPELSFHAVDLTATAQASEELFLGEGVGSWRLSEHRHERQPSQATTSPAMVLPRLVSKFATERLITVPTVDEGFRCLDGRILTLRIQGSLVTRTLGALASSGELKFDPITRRMRGQQSSEPFVEGPEAFFLVNGSGALVLSAGEEKFILLQLEQDTLYVREEELFSFEESLSWENGKIPVSASPLQPDRLLPPIRVVQFRGAGRVVLRTDSDFHALKVDPDRAALVSIEHLAGWIGRIIPRLIMGDRESDFPYIECSGEGVLLLKESAKVIHAPLQE